ncbi:uncharacterized protein V1513DRAFT_420801 [Lipomyces chichibuensis]|uniref:uncharacterized protein n=1 Tax=Lipomyces chichibuensis TaxID=1546026 RepID=UPI003343329C
MVGVAGGSKGCSTCRNRKIKCDLQLPVCGQCIRSRRQCSGPNLTRPMPVIQTKSIEHKFVIMSATPDQLRVDDSIEVTDLQYRASVNSIATCGYARSSVLSSSSSSSSLSSSPSLSDVPVDEIPTVLDKAWPDKYEAISAHANDGPMEAVGVDYSDIMFTGPALGNAYFQILLSSFMDHFCLMASTRFDGAVFDPWIQSIPKFVYSETSALTYASRAVVVGHFSRVRPNRDLQIIGTQLYVQALRHQCGEISRSIRLPSIHDDIISTGLLLGLYEVFFCTTADSWSELVKGCLELFELRGPHAFKSGLSSILFQSARTVLTIYVLSGLTPSFLAEPEWMTIPFETVPEKPPHQTLNDILLCIPQYQRIIRTYRPRPHERRKLLLEQRMAAAEAFFCLAELRTKLDKWLVDYKRTISGIDSAYLPDNVLYTEDYYKKCDSNATDEQWSNTHIFKPPLVFANNSVANLIPLYYTALTTIQKYQCAAYDCAQEFPRGRVDLVTMRLEDFERLSLLRIDRYNRLVCQSVEYVVGINPAVGTLNIVYPLKTVQALLQDPLEKYWAFKWCEKLDKHFGLAISMIHLSEDDSADAMIPETGDLLMIPETVDLLPTCSHCGEKIRANGRELLVQTPSSLQVECVNSETVSS